MVISKLELVRSHAERSSEISRLFDVTLISVDSTRILITKGKALNGILFEHCFDKAVQNI